MPLAVVVGLLLVLMSNLGTIADGIARLVVPGVTSTQPAPVPPAEPVLPDPAVPAPTDPAPGTIVP